MTDLHSSNLLSRLKAVAQGGVDFDCEITEHTRREIVEAEVVAGLALAEIERLRAALEEAGWLLKHAGFYRRPHVSVRDHEHEEWQRRVELYLTRPADETTPQHNVTGD